MSFAEYLSLVVAEPTRQLRVVDAVHRRLLRSLRQLETVKYPWGEVRRFKLFDAPWAERRGPAVRPGARRRTRSTACCAASCTTAAPNKLILLHGPNGSAKSTFIRCLGRALEHYSTLDEGALYRFSWIFPAQKQHASGGIGFGGVAAAPTIERRSSRSRTCPTT